jgi:hypothetical protein
VGDRDREWREEWAELLGALRRAAKGEQPAGIAVV